MVKRRQFTLSATQYMQQVRLPGEFHEHARCLAQNLLKEALYRYHTHRHEHRGRLDLRQWKLAKERDEMAIYKSTTAGPAPGAVPDLVAIGGLPGALEDVLHGVVNLTPEAMQAENALVDGDLVDSRILAILEPPTTDAPFDAMTLKWVLRDHAAAPKRRDYVYLESTGVTTSADGERLGYLVVHSVSIAAVPEFHKDANIVRGQLSCCYLYRQRRQHGVEVFFKGNINPQGGIKERAALSVGIQMVLASPGCVQLAMMKKLSFALRAAVAGPSHGSASPSSSSNSSSSRSRLESASVVSRTSGSFIGRGQSFLRRVTSSSQLSEDRSSRGSALLRRLHSRSTDEHRPNACGNCARGFGAFASRTMCQLCEKIVCSRCRIVKQVILCEEHLLHPDKVEFCSECVASTSNTSAAWMAAQELEQLEHMLLLTTNENDHAAANRLHPAPREGPCVEKPTGRPVWECSHSEDRPTMSTVYSTRSSSSSRYWINVPTTRSGSVATGASMDGDATEDGAFAFESGEGMFVSCSPYGGSEDASDQDDDDDHHRHHHESDDDASDETDDDRDREDDDDDLPIIDSIVDDDDEFDDAADELCIRVPEA